MRVSIVGSGYVGTTVAACFTDMGHDVVNVDIDQDIVDAINAGKAPIHEPGLDDLLATHGGDTLAATTDYEDVLRRTSRSSRSQRLQRGRQHRHVNYRSSRRNPQRHPS